VDLHLRINVEEEVVDPSLHNIDKVEDRNKTNREYSEVLRYK
jgi:hypothetical protein